jgi:hypothetical protein
MKKCAILMDQDGEQVRAGTVTFSKGRIKVAGYDNLMASVLAASHLVDRGTREVTAESDPQAWFKSLPEHYNGIYLRAMFV